MSWRRWLFPWGAVVVVVIAAAFSLPALPLLPDRVVIQWKSGQPSQYLPRLAVPLSFVVSAIFPVLVLCALSVAKTAHRMVRVLFSASAYPLSIMLAGFYWAVLAPQISLRDGAELARANGPSVPVALSGLLLAALVFIPSYGFSRKLLMTGS
ncbi:hypothetical protein GCM10027070_10680 [Barrientosiimonas humi]